MRKIRVLILLLLLSAPACNFPRGADLKYQTAAAGQTATPSSAAPSDETKAPVPTAEPDRKPTADWKGGYFRVETENLLIDYPDFLSPADAQAHAGLLQDAYDSFRGIFAHGEEELYGGQKAVIVFRTTTAASMAGHNRIYMGSAIIDGMREGYLLPPDPTFFHEMGHLFSTAEEDAGRYQVFHLVGGMSEGLAEYFICHPDILKLWQANPRAKEACDLILDGIGSKGPEWTLTYLESHPVDIYGLNWNEHPAGVCGEILFPQMLDRVSETAGWGVWGEFFRLAKESGGSPSAGEAYAAWAEKKPAERMNEPLVKKAFAEFVNALSAASGRDLRTMFRGWGFEL